MEQSFALAWHGAVETTNTGFSRLIDEASSDGKDHEQVGSAKWVALAQAMQTPPRRSVDDEPDWEENLFMPAGYTYLAQFAAHDLSFDTAASMTLHGRGPNPRTPRFDLDCLYGAGPTDQPFMYAEDRATLLLGRTAQGSHDLLRTRPDNGEAPRAIIGDPRNDENAIICQLHIAFIRFHNEVVKQLKAAGRVTNLFEAARNEVRWTYQRILVEDFLPRLVRAEVRADFDVRRSPDQKGRSQNAGAYRLFPGPRDAIPLEFAQAAFRFGHSMVRNGYRLNRRRGPVRLFRTGDAPRDNDLLGFEPLEDEHVIDSWSMFFPDSGREGHGVPWPGTNPGPSYDSDRENRLQYAYKIDTSIVDPLANLPAALAASVGPSLSLRTLLRGRHSCLPSGQQIAARLDKSPLDPSKHLRTRRLKPGDPPMLEFEPIDDAFKQHTPLWFYVLAEAQAPILNALERTNFSCEPGFLFDEPATGTQLGWVGGTIVLETIHGLLDSDPDSYRNHRDADGWKPLIGKFRMWDLVTRKFGSSASDGDAPA